MKKELEKLATSLRKNNLRVPIEWKGSIGTVSESDLQKLRDQFPELSPTEIAENMKRTLDEAKKFAYYDLSAGREFSGH